MTAKQNTNNRHLKQFDTDKKKVKSIGEKLLTQPYNRLDWFVNV